MSLTANRFKSTTIRGAFRNEDYADSSILASSYIQRNLEVDGYLIPNGGIQFSITSGATINTYTLTPEILSFLSTIASDIQTQTTANADNIATNTTDIATNATNITTISDEVDILDTKCTEISYDVSSDTTTITNFVNITKEMTVNSLVIPTSQLLTLVGNIFTNGVSITPTVLSYISTLTSSAQSQLTTNANNITTNANNISTLSGQYTTINNNINGITYSSSNTNISNSLRNIFSTKTMGNCHLRFNISLLLI